MKIIAIALIMIASLMPSGSGLADQSIKAPIRMAYLQNDIHHLACWVALDKGFYGQEGIAVEIAGVFKAGPEIMTAFAAGELDMAYVGEAPATTAVANKTASVVAVAQVNTEGSAIVVARKKSSIKTIKDLQGKTVAVPGYSTVQDFLLRRALKNAGMPLDAVHIIIVKPPEMISALRTDQIDAFIAWEPYPSKAATMDVGRTLAGSKDIWAGHPCCVLVTGSQFLEKHPHKVKAVLKAHIKATEFIAQNPQESLRIGVKYTGMDEITVHQAMRSVSYTVDLNVEGEKDYVRFLSELRYIKIETPEDFVAKFLNPALLKELKP
jgi:NitT/TauT family transport system substrate-binding protein